MNYLDVEFVGEPGVDANGLKREIFSLFGLKHSVQMIRTMYVRTYGHTNIPTSPELCLGTPVLRHKPKALSTDGIPKVTYNSHT